MVGFLGKKSIITIQKTAQKLFQTPLCAVLTFRFEHYAHQAYIFDTRDSLFVHASRWTSQEKSRWLDSVSDKNYPLLNTFPKERTQ